MIKAVWCWHRKRDERKGDPRNKITNIWEFDMRQGALQVC